MLGAAAWPASPPAIRSTRDFTVDRLQAALASYVVHFPVYRTYITGRTVSAQDRAVIAKAIEAAPPRWAGPDAEIFGFLQDVLTLDIVRQGRIGYSVPACGASP